MKEQKRKSDNFLLYVPHHSDEIEWEVKKGKVVLIFHHNKLIEKAVRLFVKKPETTTLELDDIGSEVWNLIDGQRTVYEIGQDLKRKFGDTVEPLYERLVMFVKYLNKRRWIYFSRGGDNK
ncbi:MAG TPA: PqqD family protein [Clostridia bacterium]|nr:PqqD family protein [Clostridia bacterium]